jgi:predicted dehydrogenase
MKKIEGETKTGVADPREIGIRGHIIQVHDLVRAIKGNRDPMVTGESARKSVQLILAIYESSRTGKDVTIG